jgi:very-long-chain enoyl-CoA reductase
MYHLTSAFINNLYFFKAGKPLKDELKLSDLNPSGSSLKLFFKDLGPQVGWTTVFLTEYAGPLFIYLIFYMRPALIYGAKQAKYHQVVQ